jgi:1-deoxy-D-xylulose-5-phosphate reductoisomerase
LKKRIAILGSTGSIGRQALEVVQRHPERFACELLTARSNYRLLVEQALAFSPHAVVIADNSHYKAVQDALKDRGVAVSAGQEALLEALEMESIDLVLVAIVGFAGLKPTLKAIEEGKTVALANKEALVVAGDLVTGTARKKKIAILPVDSEHSAIFQCLEGEWRNPVEKVYLTASGGPFRGRVRDDLKKVTKEEALLHPNWKMGRKITIDSASLMNKGFEVIEAHWLFNLAPSQISVVIHPQSIIHSIVQFQDGSMKAQMGLPDMKLPIQYALSWPQRIPSPFPRFDFRDFPQLTFEVPDLRNFPNLAMAYEALEKGGTMPCILNASNEVAVKAYLDDRVGFLEMSDIIATCMAKVPVMMSPSYDDYIHTDAVTREKALALLNK